MVHLGNDWDEILAGEFEQDYYKRIRYWLKKEYAEQTIYPAADNIFNALRYTPYSKATKAPDVMEIGRLNTRYRGSANGSSANTPCSAADANPNENWLPSSISAALPTRFT